MPADNGIGAHGLLPAVVAVYGFGQHVHRAAGQRDQRHPRRAALAGGGRNYVSQLARDIGRAYIFLALTIGIFTPLISALVLGSGANIQEHETDLLTQFAAHLNGVPFGILVGITASVALIMAVNTAFVASSELMERVGFERFVVSLKDSDPDKVVAEKFGFTVENVAARAKKLVKIS